MKKNFQCLSGLMIGMIMTILICLFACLSSLTNYFFAFFFCFVSFLRSITIYKHHIVILKKNQTLIVISSIWTIWFVQVLQSYRFLYSSRFLSFSMVVFWYGIISLEFFFREKKSHKSLSNNRKMKEVSIAFKSHY